MAHIPVLQNETLKYLNPEPNENFIDCTVGEGGHSLAILERNAPRGKVLGIDRDIEEIEKLDLKVKNKDLKGRLVLCCGNFVHLKEIVKEKKIAPVSGILFDLGMSSWHLEESGRGFSFKRKESLDMRYNSESQLTAEKILNFWSKFEIEKILKEYGEENFSREISEKIIESRKAKNIENTDQLVGIIKMAVPGWYQKQKTHFATKTFQALRIAVNDELKNISEALPQAVEILKTGGRIVVISFHSLEDRIVKNFFFEQSGKKNEEKKSLKILTKKTVQASFEEIKNNPRSRSAKMRAAIKI